MKRLARFLVDNRKFLFIVSVLAAFCCGIMIPFVNVNSDMTKYLPDDSPMKKGIEVLTDSFDGMNISVGEVRVMFRNLPEAYKPATVDALMAFDGVDAVDYVADSPDYDNGEYTLYKLAVANSVNQKRLARAIKLEFGKNVIVETGQDGSTPSLATILIAFGLLLLILFFMCSSWLEPVLFLLTIGFAVVFNIGTNALLDSVSVTTNSIVAILQLVLSIDFSIILMNRFRQEVGNGGTREEAMIRAIRRAAPSIMSSAFTTIVGLLMLVFMKLKIGMDMGIVLAKGVLCSLVVIFTVLPALVLRFYAAIEKSHKKVRLLPTNWLAAFSMKSRYALAVAALAIFAVAFIFHYRTVISFSTKGESEIDKVFPQKNAIILAYSNEDEAAMTVVADSVMAYPEVESFNSYPTLLLQKCTAGQMASKLASLSAQAGVGNMLDGVGLPAEDLLKVIYYASTGADAALELEVGQLVKFLSAQVGTSDLFRKYVDEKTASQLPLLEKLTDPVATSKPLSAAEMASLLGTGRASISTAYSLLGHSGGKMSLRQFVSELNRDLFSSVPAAQEPAAPDAGVPSEGSIHQSGTAVPSEPVAVQETPSEHPSAVSGEIRMSISEFSEFLTSSGDKSEGTALLASFTSPATNHKALSSDDMASFFEMKASQTSIIYRLYGQSHKSKSQALSPYEFVHYLNTDITKRKMFASYFEEWQLKRLQTIEKLMTLADANAPKTAAAMASDLSSLGFTAESVGRIYALSRPAEDGSAGGEDVKDALAAVTAVTASAVAAPQSASGTSGAPGASAAPDVPSFDPSLISQLPRLKKILDISAAGKTYDAGRMARNFNSLGAGLDDGMMDLLYLFYGSVNDYNPETVMTVKSFTEYLSDTVVEDPRFSSFIDASTKDTVRDMRGQLDSSVGMLRGDGYSIAAILTHFPDESVRTNAFIDNLRGICDGNCNEDCYLIGESVMFNEMKNGFDKEMLLVTILTVLAIFLIVAISFKSVMIPAFLVMVVMSAVYINVIVSGANGNTMLYLAYLIVQSILMGATIDYGILFANYYREKRQDFDVAEALREAYKGSIHTIMTSGLIMIVAPGAMSLLVDDVAISAIVGCLSVGAMAAVVLILCVLPGLLAAFDRIVCRSFRKRP